MTEVLPFPIAPEHWGGRLLRWVRSITERPSGPGTTGSKSGPGARPGSGPGSGSGTSGAAGDGDGPPAINELYHARRLSLVRLAVLMVDDLPTAEDIVQDVFVALYRRHGANLDRISDPHAYLTVGVMNAARSALRRRRSARAYVPPPPGVVAAAEDTVMRGAGDPEVLAALGRLTVRQRQVVVLRYWSELSEQEIADTLRVSCGTVKSTASRALVILRGLLGEGS